MIARKVSVLGSTGSVGTSTLDLMDQAETAGSGAFQVEVLTGGNNIARLAEQARQPLRFRFLPAHHAVPTGGRGRP